MGDLDFASLRRAEVGSRLRVARERLGLSLDDIQQATRVPARHLEALERGDASVLPSPAYATGFVRAYARELGLDATALVRVYRGEDEDAVPPPPGTPAPDVQPSPHSDAVDDAPPGKWATLPTALLIGGGGLVLLLLLATVVLLLRPAPKPEASVELPPLQTSGLQMGAKRVELPAIAGDDSVAITAKERVWMRVYEPGGRVLFNGILAAGGVYRVPDDARDPRISTGNSRLLAMTLGGEPVSFTSRPSVIAARISPAALRAPTPSASPEDTGPRDRSSRRRQRDAGAEPTPAPASAAGTGQLPALAVTTKDAAPTVSTPLENAQ